MYHARNLDYPVDGLNGITASVTFVNSSGAQGGAPARVLYHGTSFIGYVGLLTGMRPGGFSVSVNQRTVNASQPLQAFLENIQSALSGGQSIGMFLRTALQEEASYTSALRRLNSTKLIAPVYLTMAGTHAGEGAVITRNRDHADLSHGLAAGIWALQSPPASWFRLETNYDHWAPAGDKRRATAYAEMNKLSPAVLDGQALFQVLSTPPVLNGDTRYTAVMSAATGEYYTVTRGGGAPGHLKAGPRGWYVAMPEDEE